MSQVPFFDYPRLFRDDAAEIQRVVESVLERGAFILQRDLEEFEVNLARAVGARHVVGVANGTDALMIALRSVGIGPGDEVVVPSHTYVASVAAIHFVGATPVLAECGADHLLDPDDVERAISRRTRAIMVVQLNGRTADMDRLGQIVQDRGLLLIEDAAQAVGSRFRGRHAGTFGVAGTYSFYPAKTLGCFGDGGAVVTNDDEVASRVRLLRDHGRNERGDVVGWGMNSRLDNLQAAILNVKLARLDEMIEHRRGVARVYSEVLDQLDAVDLPPGPDHDDVHFDTFQNFELEVDHRDQLRAYLAERHIATLIQWGGRPIHQLTPLQIHATLPATDRLFERCLMLPMNQFLTTGEAEAVAGAVRDFYVG